VKWDNTTWLGSQPSPLSCHCMDQTQYSQALSFIKWRWQLSCFMEETPSTINVLQESNSVFFAIKINLHAFYVFLRLSHSFFTGVLHRKWILTFMILIYVTTLSVSVTNSKTLQYMTPTNGSPMCLYSVNTCKK